ncbi:MAG: response regulator [Gammaproteobacteria bacterium]|nr:response regulator [Gammaproteobacteria bacterium]
MDSAANPAETRQYTILFVDDEPNILSSLRRLFRGNQYRVLIAGGGKEGLAVLKEERVDLVVSDARMPEMDGATFLKEVLKSWPDVMRIMLTGYSDLTTTISAINEAKIYRYISKPWEENELRLAVDGALHQRYLEQERERLERLTLKQNGELASLNANLERMVKARTAELQQTADMLDAAYTELKQGYETTVRVFASLIHLRKGLSAKSNLRVQQACRNLGKLLNFSPVDLRDVEMAASLYNVGKLAWSDELIAKPLEILSKLELEEVQRYPVMSETTLMALEPLKDCARLIRHHQEQYDGKGYPDGLAGKAIPAGSRLLKLCIDFEGLSTGQIFARPMSPPVVRDYLEKQAGIIYDPDMVQRLLSVFRQQTPEEGPSRAITSGQLLPGMVLARDLYTPSGILLLNQGKVLTPGFIERIQGFEVADRAHYTIHVKPTS